MQGNALFELGRTLMTPAARDVMAQDELFPGITAAVFLERHQAGDWGDVSADDAAANDKALEDGSRILSAYSYEGVRLWIITEAKGDDGHRAATTILLPEDY